MRARVRLPGLIFGAVVALAAAPAGLLAQTKPEEASKLPAGMSRVAGTDPASGIVYALISVEGELISGGAALTPAQPPILSPEPQTAPRLTAQCTRTGDKLQYELLFDLGGVPELIYIPPWKPRPEQQVRPPVKYTMARMDFIGYMKVKSAKREFELLEGAMRGEMLYSTPGFHTSNLEPIAYYMQYLKALPTLRLTVPGRGVVEFETLRWQAAVRAEPLCYLSSL